VHLEHHPPGLRRPRVQRPRPVYRSRPRRCVAPHGNEGDLVVNRYFFRWYWKPFLVGSALIAAAIYAPDAWLDFVGNDHDGGGDTSIRVMSAVFGAFAILIDPAFLIVTPLWNRYGRPMWDRVQRRLADR
jgi:hypothetical protein